MERPKPRRDRKPGRWKNGVRQEANGTWTAKFGQKWSRGHWSEAQAYAAKDRLRGDEAGQRPASWTVDEWADRWVAEYQDGKTSSTVTHYTERVKRVKEAFAGRGLSEVTRQEAYEFAIKNRQHVNVARAMFQVAERLGVDGLTDNPFARLGLPEARGRRDIKVLSEGELRKLVEIAEQKYGEYGRTMYGPMIELVAWAGLRPGELYAFRPGPESRGNYVDGEAGEFVVDWQMDAHTGQLRRPKNDSRRRIPILPMAKYALERLAPTTPNAMWLFTAKQGGPFTGRVSHYYWDPVRTAFAASLPPSHWLPQRLAVNPKDDLDLYELRHFFGTKLAERLMPPDVGKLMGHVDNGKTAQRYYIHVHGADARERARQAFGA